MESKKQRKIRNKIETDSDTGNRPKAVRWEGVGGLDEKDDRDSDDGFATNFRSFDESPFLEALLSHL